MLNLYKKLHRFLESKPFVWIFLRFFLKRLPLIIKNFILGFLNTKLKKHQCNICGCREIKFIYAAWAHYLLKCPYCELCFVPNSTSTKKTSWQHIVRNKKEYLLERGRYIVSNGVDKKDWDDWVDWKNQTFNRLHLEEFEKERAGHRRALDIGCAEGKVLELLNKRGWEAIGLELSEYEARLCRQSNLKIVIGTAENLPFNDGCFDLIVMFHTLEHTTDPMFTLRNIFTVLKKGGRFIFEVPYFDNKKSLFDDFQNPMHRYFFAEKGIEKILRNSGFVYLNKFIYEDKLHNHKRNICYLANKNDGSI